MFGAIEKCLESVFFLVTSQDPHMVAKGGPAVWMSVSSSLAKHFGTIKSAGSL